MNESIYIAIHDRTKQYSIRSHHVHGNLGVLKTPTLEEFRKAERFTDPVFLMLKGDINAGRMKRKRSVWTSEKDSIFFTCPWCGAVGCTHARYASLRAGVDSRYCDRCGRHLFLAFLNGDEKELVYLERKEGE